MRVSDPDRTTPERRPLALAISIERHNARFFREWALRFRTYDPGIAQLFDELVAEEQDHENQLLELYSATFGDDVVPDCCPRELQRYIHGLETIRDHFFVTDRLEAERVLRTAREIEAYSAEFYAEMAETAPDDEQRAMFRRLVEFEQDHEARFQNRLDAGKGE